MDDFGRDLGRLISAMAVVIVVLFVCGVATTILAIIR